METEATQKIKSVAKQTLQRTIVAWGLLSILSITGFLMERWPYQGHSPLLYALLILLAIALLGDLLLHIRGVLSGITLASHYKTEASDPVVLRTAMLSAVLGIAGSVISFFLFIGW